MLKTEIAEAMKDVNILEMAHKTQFAPNLLTSEENTVINEVLDPAFKNIGKTGTDPERIIASYINRTITEDVYNAPDDILDRLFDRGNVGENDVIETVSTAKNTLVAYEAAKGGNVSRSWLDISELKNETKHFQIETDISYADLRKNGWKSVATLTTYIEEAFKNKRYSVIFEIIDNAIVGGDNYLAEGATQPTQATMDKAALYLAEHSNGKGIFVALTKYIQAISKLDGASDDMKNELYKTGFYRWFDGHDLAAINSTHKLGNGDMLIPDKRIFGIAGKIGTLDMRGELRTYEDYDNQAELIKIKSTGFEFTYGFNDTTLKNIFKIALA